MRKRERVCLGKRSVVNQFLPYTQTYTNIMISILAFIHQKKTWRVHAETQKVVSMSPSELKTTLIIGTRAEVKELSENPIYGVVRWLGRYGKDPIVGLEMVSFGNRRWTVQCRKFGNCIKVLDNQIQLKYRNRRLFIFRIQHDDIDCKHSN